MNSYFKIFVIFFLHTFVINSAISQSTGINTGNPNSKAALDIMPQGKQGFLMPRMTTTDTNLIGVLSGKDKGMMFFDTLIGDIRFWNGSKWKIPGSGSGASSWLTAGNTLTDSTSRFIGSTNNWPLVLKTNGLERVHVSANGNIGINRSNPGHTLDIIPFNENDGLRIGATPKGHSGSLVFQTSSSELTFVANDKMANKYTLIFPAELPSANGMALISDLNGNLEWGTTGSVGPWEIATTGIYYNAGNVGIGSSTPALPLVVSAGKTGYAASITNSIGAGLSVTAAGSGTGIDVSGGKYGIYALGDNAVYGQGTGLGSWGGHFLNSAGNVNAYLGGNYAAVFLGGNVGIGINAPTVPLDIRSATSPAFRLIDGTQGDGKVLMSDASGNASWVTQSKYTSRSNVNNASGSNITATPTDINNTNFFTFTKLYDDSKLEVHLNSRISVGTFTGASGLIIEVRVGNIIADIAPAEIGITAPGSSQYYSSFTVFGNVPAGSHNIRIYASTNAGTCSTVILNPGGWGGRITVKETW